MNNKTPAYPTNHDELLNFRARNPRLSYWLGFVEEHPRYPPMDNAAPHHGEPPLNEGQSTSGGRQNRGGNQQALDVPEIAHLSPPPPSASPPPVPALPVGPPVPIVAQRPLHVQDPRDILISVALDEAGKEKSIISATTACSFSILKLRVRDILRLGEDDDLVLGYKYHKDKRKGPPHPLATEEQFKEAMDIGYGYIKRATSRKITLELYNISTPQQAPNVASASTQVQRAGGQNKVVAQPKTEQKISFASQYRELAHKLFCNGCTIELQKKAREAGTESSEKVYCFINPITLKHDHIADMEMNWWSQEILLGRADYEYPPESATFDRFHRKPRRAAKKPSPANTSVPDIHVHVHASPGASGDVHIPLTDKLGQRRINVEVPKKEKEVLGSDVKPEICNEEQRLDSPAPNTVATPTGHILDTVDSALPQSPTAVALPTNSISEWTENVIDLTGLSSPSPPASHAGPSKRPRSPSPGPSNSVIDLSGSSPPPPPLKRPRISKSVGNTVLNILRDGRRRFPHLHLTLSNDKEEALHNIGVFDEHDFWIAEKELLAETLQVPPDVVKFLQEKAKKYVHVLLKV